MAQTQRAPRSRAHSETRDELLQTAEALGAIGFWAIREQFEQVEPKPREVPHIWHRRDYEPLVHDAARLIPVEEADRRNLMFANPGLDGEPFITNILFGGIQSINPGEVAPVHRHTGAAVRLMLEGDGAYTTVENDKSILERGDVVINPNWAWHENGNDGSETIYWFDILDIPLSRMLNGNFFDNHYTETTEEGAEEVKEFQSVRREENWAAQAYGAGGVRPAYVPHEVARGLGAPQALFSYEPTRALLERLKGEAGSPEDGLIVEYFNSANGGPAMRTLDIHMQMIRTGEETRPYRRTAGKVYCCLEGNGTTVVGEKELRWQENDIFVVPAWSWHHHKNDTSEDAVLYCVSDAPAMRALGYLREERRMEDGSTEAAFK